MDPRGFGSERLLWQCLRDLVGHIGITVDDVYTACERFEKLGVEFVKRPDEGNQKSLGENTRTQSTTKQMVHMFFYHQ